MNVYINAAVVHDDVFIVPVGLLEDALDAFRQERGTIVDRGHHADQRRFMHGHLRQTITISLCEDFGSSVGQEMIQCHQNATPQGQLHQDDGSRSRDLSVSLDCGRLFARD